MDEVKSKYREQTVGYLSAAFGLIAGLAWNDAVKQLIETVFPADQGTIVAKFIYAALITAIVVLVSNYLTRWAQKGK